MNITLNKIDSVNGTITIDVAKEDYINEVEKSIKNLRKDAIIPGFRKGTAPLYRIHQIYGKSVLAEEINKLVIDKLFAYIKEENLTVLGEPLPSLSQEQFDFGKQENYSYTFDIGLAPQIDISLSKDDKLPYYLIEVTDEMIDNQINRFKADYGTNDNVEEAEENDMVKGVLNELNKNGEPKENGILNETVVLMPAYIINEEEKAKFIGAGLNTTIVFNPYRAYEGNAAELSSFLKIKKEQAKNYTGNFSLEIKEINRYKEAEINQELFNKVFKSRTVTTEEVFREKTREFIAQKLIPNSDYKLGIDVCNYLKEKAGELQFPEMFLKRWLSTSSSKENGESLDADYPKIIEDLKFRLIKDQLIKDYGIEVTDSDINNAARQAVRKQLNSYGMTNIPSQVLENYGREMLKKEESVRQLTEETIETKLTDLYRKKLTLETQTVTYEEFRTLLEEETK